MSKNDGGNAFPATETTKYSKPGMTLRDYFAGQALAAFAGDYQMRMETSVERAYDIADAMLKERDK